jgi:hypothetical protein
LNNVVDRVPTEVLSNGAVRWEQFDSSGNSLGYVYLKRADEPSVEGTKINKVLFDSIADDLDSRLLSANKATQAEAEAGTNNTKYMTPLRTKQFANKNVGVKITRLNISGSADNTIDLSTYLTSNVEELEIVINCIFSSTTANKKPITINGTGIRESGGTYGSASSSHVVGGVQSVGNALATIQIYPNANYIAYYGSVSSGAFDSNNVNGYLGYGTVSTITLGRKDSVATRNYDYQVSIYQYLK